MRIALTESVWRVRLLPINAVQPFAIEALAEGFSGPALFELADGGYGTWREVETGRASLTEEEAAMQAAWCMCEDIASGVAEPYRGARLLGQLRDHDQIHEIFAALIYFEEINLDHDGRSSGDEEEIRQLAREMVADRDTVGG